MNLENHEIFSTQNICGIRYLEWVDLELGFSTDLAVLFVVGVGNSSHMFAVPF